MSARRALSMPAVTRGGCHGTSVWRVEAGIGCLRWRASRAHPRCQMKQCHGREHLRRQSSSPARRLPRLARQAFRNRGCAQRRVLQGGLRQAESQMAGVGRRGPLRRLDRRRAKAHRRRGVPDPIHSTEQEIHLELDQRQAGQGAHCRGSHDTRGARAYERRTERKSTVYSYEQKDLPSLTPNELATFRMNERAWAYLEKAPPSYRRTMVHWVVTARQQATRARRLARFIESCAAGVRFLP